MGAGGGLPAELLAELPPWLGLWPAGEMGWANTVQVAALHSNVKAAVLRLRFL
jgi:hypothetical protein